MRLLCSCSEESGTAGVDWRYLFASFAVASGGASAAASYMDVRQAVEAGMLLILSLCYHSLTLFATSVRSGQMEDFFGISKLDISFLEPEASPADDAPPLSTAKEANKYLKSTPGVPLSPEQLRSKRIRAYLVTTAQV